MTRLYTHEEYGARRYFPELDGVRAVSVLLVFTTHLDVLFWEHLQGSTGVTFFFVLSGYLITTLSLREESSAGRFGLGSFYLRRVFRIYPLYLFVLGTYCVLVLGLGMASERRDSFVHSLPYYLAFLPEQALLGYQGVEPPFAGAWSLGIEEKFYFVWPLLGFVVLAGRFRGRIAALLVAIVAFPFGGLLFGDIGTLVEPYALLALGCLIAVLLHNPSTYERLKRLGEVPVFGVLVGVLVVCQLVPGITLGHPLYVVYGVLATAVFVGLLTSRSKVAAVLSTRPMVFLGRISYAFYLTHNFAINGAQGALPGGVLFDGFITPVAALALAVGLAWGLHITVEKPMIKLGHKIAHRNKEWRGLPAATGGPGGPGGRGL
jgi:peptidoglycan/LPS O-acetylase OafA/YrhL